MTNLLKTLYPMLTALSRSVDKRIAWLKAK